MEFIPCSFLKMFFLFSSSNSLFRAVVLVDALNCNLCSTHFSCLKTVSTLILIALVERSTQVGRINAIEVLVSIFQTFT